MTLPDSTRITRRRPPWLTLAVALVVVVLVAVGLVFFVNRGAAEPTSQPTGTTAPSASPDSSLSAGAEAGARGCLGGVDPNKAILQAHDEAELTPRGAAEFAGTFLRWSAQYPPDTTYEKIASQVVHPDAGADLLTVDRDLIDKSSTAWGTTLDSHYRVTSFGDEAATVELVASGYVVKGGDEEPVILFGRWRLRAIDGHWLAFDMDTLDESTMNEVKANGFGYEGGC